jgi:UDPglucose--hexose-1-phosphate uridylyltransferase
MAAGEVLTIRRHLITGDAILFAPERAQRPNAYAREATICPFCPGHESETPPEIARTGDPWRVRAFPNKYPFAAYHELVVEMPEHDGSFATIAHANEVVAMYAARYRELSVRDGIEYVALFKNHGAAAGASLRHEHSQLAALPFVPPRVVREREAFARASVCPLCSGGTTIDENETFRVVDPGARMFVGERWIVPKRHVAELSDLAPNELDDLATMLQSNAAAMTGAYNWLFFSFPQARRAHFYVDIFPRTSPVAGFELMTDTFVDSEL